MKREEIELRAVGDFKEAFSLNKELHLIMSCEEVKSYVTSLGIPLTYVSPLSYMYFNDGIWHVKKQEALIATVTKKDDFYSISSGYLLGKIYRERRLTYKGEAYEQLYRCLPAFDDTYVNLGRFLHDDCIRPINGIEVTTGDDVVRVAIQGLHPYFITKSEGFSLVKWRNAYQILTLSISESNSKQLREAEGDNTSVAINKYIAHRMMYLLECAKRPVEVFHKFDTDEKGRKPDGIIEIELTTGLQFV